MKRKSFMPKLEVWWEKEHPPAMALNSGNPHPDCGASSRQLHAETQPVPPILFPPTPSSPVPYDPPLEKPLEPQPKTPSWPISGSGSGVGQSSWKSTLFPDGKPATMFKLRFIPPSSKNANIYGVCSKEAVEGELELLDFTLVGFFLGKRPSFSFVKAALLRQWKIRGNVGILQLIHGGYAFRFSELSDRDSILDANVFFLGGQPMFVRKWDRSLHTGGILGLRKVPLWVTLPGLPLHLWGEESLSAIGSVLGTPLYSDRTTALKNRLMFARICVEFAGNTPLLDSVSIEDDIGMVYEQQVKYEWKPPHCLSCGIFGHAECKIAPMVAGKCHITSSCSPHLDEEVHSLNESRGHDASELQTPMDSLGSGAEHGGDSDWKVVRARKKKPAGVGAPTWVQTRKPDLVDKVAAENSDSPLVSSPHWPPIVPVSRQKVHTPAPSPTKEKFSNSMVCSKKAPCPLSSLDLVEPSQVSNGPLSDLVVPQSLHNQKKNGPPRESSAGHTPYSNRLSIMARDLRLGKMGRGHSFVAHENPSLSGLESGPILGPQNSNKSVSALGFSKQNDTMGFGLDEGDPKFPSLRTEPHDRGPGHSLKDPGQMGYELHLNSSQRTEPGHNDLALNDALESVSAWKNKTRIQNKAGHSMDGGKDLGKDREMDLPVGPEIDRA